MPRSDVYCFKLNFNMSNVGYCVTIKHVTVVRLQFGAGMIHGTTFLTLVAKAFVAIKGRFRYNPIHNYVCMRY